MAKAALESVGFTKTRDLLESDGRRLKHDGVQPTLGVDGGMSASRPGLCILSRQSSTLPSTGPRCMKTALGVAWLAGMHAGVYL